MKRILPLAFFLAVLALRSFACAPPSNPNLVWAYANTATFSILQGGSSNHQLSIGQIGTPAANGSIFQFSGTTTTLTGLLSNTSYSVYFRDSCTNGQFSSWIGPLIFKTKCNPEDAPWSENFDGPDWIPSPNNQLGTWPNCWSRSIANSGLNFLAGPPTFNTTGTGPNDDHSIGNAGQYLYLRAVGFGTSGPTANFTTPIINLATLNSPELSFWYHAFGTQISGSQVHLIDSIGGSYLIWTSTGQIQNNQSSPWEEQVISLVSFSNQKIQLRFTGISNAPFPFLCQLAYDDIDIHEKPNCLKPTNLSVPSSNQHE